MKRFTIIALSSILLISGIFAQRKSDKLDRGVVAVRNSAGNFFVSWRFFATDADDVTFNLYAKKIGATAFTKLNSTALNLTNFSPASGTVGAGTQLYVTAIINGTESAPSGIFTIPANGFTTYRSGYLDITYNTQNDGLELYKYYTKFCWPADLDGDGEYDFVVDRLATDGISTHKIQAYLRNGTLLWTVDVGPNISIDQGQDDMVIAYDMDGDGKSEVIIKSSDGTVFSNGKGVGGSVSTDTDNDGIIDYNNQNVKNPPQYISVINGLTGVEKNSIEMKYPSNYSRTNKAVFMGTEYSNLNGHMAIVYLDGKHPSVGFIYKTRTSSDQYHWYYASAYGYDKTGNFVNWYNWERGKLDCAEGHGIRAADVDLDGRDELLDIGYGIKYDGTLAFNAHISHGDRFRVGDIDPERPGLETYAIQQNASSLLGQLIYDSGTGEAIKKFYLSGVGDVGRGECMDVDSTRTGYEFWSTMPNIYDAKGNIIFEGATPFPNEGIWWDGDLAREELTSPDGNGFNADIRKYDINTHDFGNRLIEIAKMTNYQLKTEYGRRPAFFGDIAGDWREELILEKKGTQQIGDSTYSTCPGIVAFSTDYPTSKRIYCLMQNPAYRIQATTKGYYQSAFPDFYLGFGMPAPPVAPIQQAKLSWVSGNIIDKSSSNFVLSDEVTKQSFADGDDVMFDISGDNSAPIQIGSDIAPSKIWAINPLGHDYILNGTNKLTGSMEFIKSLNGTFTLNGNHTYTGKTIISEGNLLINGAISSPVTVQAKGTLGGNAVLNGGIVIQPGLNIEGGRLSPGNGLDSGKLGKITINSDLNLNGKTNILIDILPFDNYKNDSLVINGNLTLSGLNKIVINTESGVLPSGTFSLIKWSGVLSGTLSNFAIAGISGLPMSLVIENNTLKLVVNATRSAGNILWTGKENGTWDYLSANFNQSENPTYFVNGDSVQFNDAATNKTITISDNMTVAKTKFINNTSYVLKGNGGIIGTGDFEKSGKGLLDIQTVNNNFTGKVTLTNALVQIASIADAGSTSSLGSSAALSSNILMTDTRLIINSVTSNSNRGLTLVGSDTINVPKSNGVISLTGEITGSGKLIKTGPGQLNLSGNVANTYSGGTIINGSSVALGSLVMNSNGFGTGTITLENGGKISMYYNTADYNQKPTWNLIIPENNTGTLITSGRCNINGTISGAGTLNYNVPYVRADLVASGANFTGKINVTTDADGGSFRLTANSTGFPLAQIILPNLVDMGAYANVGDKDANATTTAKIGSLAGVTGSTLGGGKWTIGSDNRDAVFNGTINSTATITKTGTGAWTLTGANLCTAAFTINGGKVIVANSTGSATGTGTLTVNNSGSIAGTGIISGGVIISQGGNIQPGNTTTGTLTLGNNLVMQTGSKMSILISGANNFSTLSVSGTAVLKGTLELTNSGASYSAGSSYKIINAGSISGAFDAIIPEKPGTNLKWNISRITEGIISVDVADGIDDITSDNIKIFPSIVKDYCVIQTDSKNSPYNIELFDGVGKMIMTEVTNENMYKLYFNKRLEGFFYLKITDNQNQSYLRKLIIKK